MWRSIGAWFREHEFVAIWLEGIALVAIFVWDRLDSRSQHRETLKQLAVAQTQAEATKQAAEAASKTVAQLAETAEKQLRAYLCVTRIDGKIGPNFIRIQVHVKNSGVTPAYDVRQWIHQWIDEYPLRVTLPEPPENFRMSCSALGPGDFNIMPAGWENLPSNLVVGTAKQTIYIYGKVVYKDAFGQERYTKYRFIYGTVAAENQHAVGSSGIVPVMLSPDAEGNEQT